MSRLNELLPRLALDRCQEIRESSIDFHCRTDPVIDWIRQMSKGTILLFEAIMLRRVTVNSRTEHDLFIRLFLTSGGGW